MKCGIQFYHSLSKLGSNVFEYILWIVTAFIIHEQNKLNCDMSTMKDVTTSYYIMGSSIAIGVSKIFGFIVKLRKNGSEQIEYWDQKTKILDIISDVFDLTSMALQAVVVALFNQNNHTLKTRNHQVQIGSIAIAIGLKLIQRIIKWTKFCKCCRRNYAK